MKISIIEAIELNSIDKSITLIQQVFSRFDLVRTFASGIGSCTQRDAARSGTSIAKRLEF